MVVVVVVVAIIIVIGSVITPSKINFKKSCNTIKDQTWIENKTHVLAFVNSIIKEKLYANLQTKFLKASAMIECVKPAFDRSKLMDFEYFMHVSLIP